MALSRRRLLNLATGGVLLLLCALFAFTGYLTVGLPDVTRLDKYDPAAGTKIYAADGTLVANLIDESRNYVPYKAIAPVMVDAIVAIEDRRFFDHEGVDLRGVARAVLGNIESGGVRQGASTLTMQLARRLFLTDERTYSRKVRESVLAYRMDRALSKEKILELYLNEVYFGGGAYGIGAAAELYFGKKPADLDLWEASLLAGLVQAPSALSPLADKPAALKRMNEVLDAMLAEQKISEPQVMAARNDAAVHRFEERLVQKREGLLDHPYYTSYVINELKRQFPGRDLRRSGLQVVTSLDVAMQVEAERALRDALLGGAGAQGADRGAIVALSNETGEIVAMAGGLEWSRDDEFNPAWQARRQPGSTFKPFVYAAALEAGYSPEQEFADTEATFGPASDPWTPENSDQKTMGAIPMRTGLQFSRNIVAAKVIAHVGPDAVINLAEQMGLDSDLPRYVSLSLGAGVATPLQLARAYSAFPSGGIQRPATLIRKVTSDDGNVNLDFTAETPENRVLSEGTAAAMCEMLKRVVDRGTGTAAAVPGTFVGGKTGTTDRFADAWFVGFTPRHTIATWVGRDDNQPMATMYGGGYPAEMFARVARMGMNGQQTMELPGVALVDATEVVLCQDSTYVASPGCPGTYTDSFAAGPVASRDCPMHRTPGLGNPRFDREVVAAADARIAYTEAAPAYSPGVALDIRVQPAPSASASPSLEITMPNPTPGVGPNPDDIGRVEEDLSLPTAAPSSPEPAASAYPTAPPTFTKPSLPEPVAPEPASMEPPPQAPVAPAVDTAAPPPPEPAYETLPIAEPASAPEAQTSTLPPAPPAPPAPGQGGY